MEKEHPEPIAKLIQTGYKKVTRFEEHKEAEWNRIIALIDENWVKIEGLVKNLLPAEIRDYFSILRSEIYQKIDETNRGSYVLSQENIDLLKTHIPEVNAIGKRGVISIPGLSDIITTVNDEGNRLVVLFDSRENFPNSAEQDGSLEVAVYFASENLPVKAQPFDLPVADEEIEPGEPETADPAG